MMHAGVTAPGARLLAMLLLPWGLFLLPPTPALGQTAQELDAMHVPLKRHRPIYFVLSDEESRVQLSFSFPFGPETGFHLAYSQTIYWSLFEDSLPVEAIRYQPELFYRFERGSPWLQRVDIGLEHDSNGLDGDVSRTYDAAYLETVSYLDAGRRDVRWANRLFAYYYLGKENPDFPAYRSIYQTELSYHPGFIEGDRLMLSGALRDRSKIEDREESGLGLGAYEIGYHFPMPYGENGSVHLYVQYYNGYNETWRGYDERVSHLRAGFMVR